MTNLPFPVAALSQHVLALGKTGSGKSSKLRVAVEYLLEREEPVTIVDPKGDWWGLKSSADGTRGGFPIVIFGGEHADVPINEHSGAHVAELVATGNRPALIDLGGWMVGERTRFFIAFAGTYFKLCKGKRTLVLPEVHNFAPQGKIMDPDAGKMLHWANRLASEGRGKGITILADSQRPQKVHKDFATSCETLIACRVIHKLDRDAIKDWIDGCADPAAGKQVLAELAQMQRTDAWVWSPEIGFGPKCITFPMFKTYDSFKPQAADVGKLTGWASVDLDDVKAKLLMVLEEAKANDPRELRKQIATLARQLAEKSVAAPASPRTAKDTTAAETIKQLAPLVKRQRAAIEALMKFLVTVNTKDFGADGPVDPQQIQKAIDAAVTQAMKLIESKFAARAREMDSLRLEGQRIADRVKRLLENDEVEIDVTVQKNQPFTVTPMTPRAAPAAVNGNANVGDGSLSKSERAILTVLAQCGGLAAKSKVAVITGYASTGGGFNNSLGSLRSKGYIETGDPIRLTDAGSVAIGPVPPLPQGQELLDHWTRQLGKAESAALKVIYEAYPNFIEKESIAQAAGYEASGGGFNNALGKLRTLELIEGRGAMRASEAFFS